MTRGATRRGWLQGLVAGAGVLPFAHLSWPGRAQGSDLSLGDRVKLLYSNQFHFTARGEPQITVGLVQRVERVVLSAKAGLVVLPSGTGGTSIAGGSRFVVDLVRGHAAEQRFGIVLDQVPATDPASLEHRSKLWQRRGFNVTEVEVGALFGVKGKVLDNRRTLLVTERFDSEAAARARADALAKEHGTSMALHPMASKPSQGALDAHDPDHGVRIHAEGVLWFASQDGGPITVQDVRVDSAGRKAPAPEPREYWGGIYVAIDRYGKLAVVNLVGETELLAGLVPAEIFASAPAAALRAQAVAARGQLLAKVGTRHLDDPFLLCADQHCQVYAGRLREHPRTTAAVAQTAGWVAMRPGGTQLVDTVYSANSGGHSEDNDAVWPSAPDPQLRARPDPLVEARFAKGITAANIDAWLANSPRSYSAPAGESHQHAYRWNETLDPGSIAGAPGVPTSLGAVTNLRVLERGRSGRATRIRLEGEGGAVQIHGEYRIRQALGGLRSSLFVVQQQPTTARPLLLRGGGHGHGVGLCQHGAMGMAAAGWTHAKILAHYYQDARLLKLW